MAKGYLKINVYSDTIANPIKEANITIIKNDNVILNTTTNENGQTDLITLNTINKSYSEIDQKQTRPYETYDILVNAFGLTPTRINGVQIFDDITSIQNIYLTSLDENQNEEISNISPNVLWGNYPDYIMSNEENNNGIAPIILKEVLIPSTIVIHDGNPNDNSAPNYTVPFTEYIKNVASSEIYSTWPKETIKANILAIISFTLNRIYTEWYRSRGYNFTITSTTTYDQKYTRNGTIFEPISQMVDEIFNNYIRRGIRLEPLLAHYKSNTNESGYLSQWGSKELGDQGYSAIGILRYYYGNDVNIYDAKVTNNYPYSFTTTLKQGNCNSDIYFLQNALNYIHGSYPGIPLIQKPTGYFGDSTEDSVKAFQKAFSLPVTGQVDYATWYKISYILTAVKDLTESIY